MCGFPAAHAAEVVRERDVFERADVWRQRARAPPAHRQLVSLSKQVASLERERERVCVCEREIKREGESEREKEGEI